ncbi:alpha-2-macroglobulin family protein, partial [Kordia jejudonensis]|uniref:hypothetical protein n=1 Tax=Kordia jejudonensis TaxID=1348245 RepID=UPI0006297DF6
MKYYSVIFSLFFLSCLCCHAQVLDDVANERLVTKHESLAEKELKENIYIHTDKDIYEPGENLWFKAYILNANDLKISTETEVIFVELLKEEENKEKMITKEVYIANSGFAYGHLFLAEILEEGNYQLIVHTKNTIENHAEAISAVKRFEIRQNIIPKILIDTEFLEDSYRRNDEVILDVDIFSRNRVALKEAAISADIYSTEERLARVKVKTDSLGQARIIFTEDETAKAEFIELRVKYKQDVVYHIIDIPFKKPASIQFGMYPEGGSLIENLPNTVAFKALNHHGKPLNVKGTLYEDGKKLSTFKAMHYGMGKFIFTPKPEKKYTVTLSNPALDSVFQLPLVQKKGLRLQVQKRDPAFIHFAITKTPNVTLKKVYIRAQSRGYVYWMAIASLDGDHVRFKLPLEKLPQGIVEVTLFNDRYQPLTERLVYANINKKLHVELTAVSKSLFTQKDKVDLTFSVKDQYGKPARAHFSLSVYDQLYGKKNNDYSMMPHYYLFSELKGHVYDASYYFDTKNKNREKHLDLVLLTQGWRNYNWNTGNLLKNLYKKADPFSEEVTGRAYYRMKSGTLRNGADATVQVLLPKLAAIIKANKGGSFSIPLAFQKAATGSRITLIPQLSIPAAAKSSKKDAIPTEAFLEITEPFEEIFQRTVQKQLLFPLDDRIINEKKQSSYDTSFSFSETNYLDEVELTGYKDRLKDRGDQVIFEGVVGDYVCFEYDILNCQNHYAGPTPVEGKKYKLNDGTEVIYKASKETIEAEKKKRGFFNIKGVYPTKEFYSPMYDKEEDKLFPDNRKTLFWSPALVSDKNGNINVSFYTSDIQSIFLGKLEGTDG